jgi:AcrR family transcriptional regulator
LNESYVDCARATIYSFFGGKEGLFSALIEERTEHILAGFKDIGIGTVDVRKGPRALCPAVHGRGDES